MKFGVDLNTAVDMWRKKKKKRTKSREFSELLTPMAVRC
jgi:hypothetical protein